MDFFYTKKNEKYNDLPTSEHIYKVIFSELINKIKSLEFEYLNNKHIVDEDKQKIIKEEIKQNIDNLNILFNDPRIKSYINLGIEVDKDNSPITPSKLVNPNKLNQFVIIIDNLKIYWVVYKILTNWANAGGSLLSVSKKNLLKYDKVKFLNEIDKGFKKINKELIESKINEYYDFLDQEQKIKYHTYQMYLLLKKKNPALDDAYLTNIFHYYTLGINSEMLDTTFLHKMLEYIEQYYKNKKNDDISDNDLTEYQKIVDKYKISTNNLVEFKKRYYSNKLTKILSLPNYKEYKDKIFDVMKILREINYKFNSKQKRKLEYFKLKLEKPINKFEYEYWSPLFTRNELDELKCKILFEQDNICKLIKKIFPQYAISYDFFCRKNNETGKLIYSKQDDINKTINAQCVVMILVGIISHKLYNTFQDYQIIIKGGKALQLIMSKYNECDEYKSNDIDLIISPIEDVEYEENKCKIFAYNFSLLIKWILNKNDNPYNKINYISTIQGKEYKTLIKISHKIQNSDDEYHLSAYTAIVDIDYGKKNSLMFNNLTHDIKQTSEYGNLLYIHQNFDDFMLEKVYYIDYYIKEYNKLKHKFVDQSNIKIELDNYHRFIKKFASQIKQMIKIKLSSEPNTNIEEYFKNLFKQNNMNFDIKNIIEYSKLCT